MAWMNNRHLCDSLDAVGIANLRIGFAVGTYGPYPAHQRRPIGLRAYAVNGFAGRNICIAGSRMVPDEGFGFCFLRMT